MGCGDILSPELLVHLCRIRGCHSNLLKVPKDTRRLHSSHRVKFLWHENVESSRNVLLSFTALFKNTWTLKFQSLLHNCVFHCCQSYFFFITITSNEPWNTEIHKTDQNSAITNHKLWPFEPVGVNFCFLRGLLRWLMAVKNSYVSCLLDFRICVFLESAVSLDKIQRCNSTLFKCFLAVLSCLFNYSTKDAFFLNIYRNLLLFK